MNREEPLLAAVVIARNEERHVGACLQSLVSGLKAFPGSPVVLVDSDSSDDTVRIASSFPVRIYRYRAPFTTAAAGRSIGFRQVAARYVLFVDADSYIEGAWLTRAVTLMEASPKAALIYGARREMFEGVSADFASQGPAPEEYGLGGNALYRSDVLREVNGFNPFIAAEEEGELFGRIQAAGYHAIRSRDVMFRHNTLPKDTLQSLVRRHRNRLSHGPGQILRLSITQGLFFYHARRFNRYLLMLAYLTAGVILSAAGAFFAAPWLPLLWIASGVTAFSWLLFRRRSLRSALCIVIDWVLVALSLGRDFFERPRHPELFEAVVERVK